MGIQRWLTRTGSSLEGSGHEQGLPVQSQAFSSLPPLKAGAVKPASARAPRLPQEKRPARAPLNLRLLCAADSRVPRDSSPRLSQHCDCPGWSSFLPPAHCPFISQEDTLGTCPKYHSTAHTIKDAKQKMGMLRMGSPEGRQ